MLDSRLAKKYMEVLKFKKQVCGQTQEYTDRQYREINVNVQVCKQIQGQVYKQNIDRYTNDFYLINIKLSNYKTFL